MATNFSDGVAALARQIALDQVAQDIDVNAKLAQKVNSSDFSNLQSQVSTQATQISQNTSSVQSAQAQVDDLTSQIISVCNDISGAS